MNSPLNKPHINLPRWKRFALFTSFIIIGFVCGIDPAATATQINQILIDLNLTESEFGIFSSLLFFGKLLGSFGFIFIVNKINRKYLYIGTLYIFSLSLFITTITTNKLVLYSSRIVLGFSSVYFGIYVPVWTDQFGMRNMKSIMFTFINISFTIGGLFGSILSTYISSWKICFYIETAVVFVITSITLLFSEKYFSNKLYSKQESKRESAFIEIHTKDDKDGDNSNNNTQSNVCMLFKKKIFLAYSFGTAFAFIPMIGFGTFAYSYLEHVLGVKDKTQRLFSMSLLTLIMPVGAVIGGVIGQCAGGYHNKRVHLFVNFLLLISVIGGLLLPYMKCIVHFTFVNVMMSLAFSAMFPCVMGIIINSVPLEMKVMASSFNSFINNLIGTLPSPYLYAIINERYRETQPNAALMILYMFPLITLVLFIYGTCVKYYTNEKEEENNKGEELKDLN